MLLAIIVHGLLIALMLLVFWLGAFGLVAGAISALGLLSGSLSLDVHGMLAVVMAQAGWTICIGAWLVHLAREQTAQATEIDARGVGQL